MDQESGKQKLGAGGGTGIPTHHFVYRTYMHISNLHSYTSIYLHIYTHIYTHISTYIFTHDIIFELNWEKVLWDLLYCKMTITVNNVLMLSKLLKEQLFSTYLFINL